MAANVDSAPGANFGSHPLRVAAIVAVVCVCLALGVTVLIRGGGTGGTPGKLTSVQVASTKVVRSRHGMLGEASWAPGHKPAPAIRGLTDQYGHRFSLASLRGRPVALVFFDSHCKSSCPLEGRALAMAEAKLPRAQRPVVVAVSVNTKDTPASAAHAVHEWGLSQESSWYWLMGSRAELKPNWAAYHIWVGPEVKGDVQHTEAMYLIDKRGDLRSAYMWPFDFHLVRHDLRVLADSKD